MQSLTPFPTFKEHRTIYNHTSIHSSHILKAGHVGVVVAVSVAIAAGDGLAAAGNGRPTNRQNSWYRILASLGATQLRRQWKESLGCSISTSGTQCRKPSSKLHWSLWHCVIAGSVPVRWMLRQIMVWILSIFLAWTSGKEERKSALRPRNTSRHVLLTMWLLVLVSQLDCAPLPGPHPGRTLNLPVFKADRLWWMALVARAMNVRFILSIIDQSFIRICHMP